MANIQVTPGNISIKVNQQSEALKFNPAGGYDYNFTFEPDGFVSYDKPSKKITALKAGSVTARFTPKENSSGVTGESVVNIQIAATSRTVYVFKGHDYYSEWELRNAHPELIFPELNEEIMQLLGVTTRQEPIPEPTPEEVEKQKLDELKRQREQEVRNIKVTVGDKVFDGDEDAQRRMVVAIQTAEIASLDRTAWVLANNTVVEVTLVELKQALAKAAQEMAKVWTKPYQG